MNLDQQLADLEQLDRKALAVRWEAAFGHPAPPYAQSPLLRGAVAWHLQMAAHGGERRVESSAKALRRAVGGQPEALAVGSQLLRSWQGMNHRVTVVADGFEYSGKVYKSLTAIARAITGTSWSGPAFFGLR